VTLWRKRPGFSIARSPPILTRLWYKAEIPSGGSMSETRKLAAILVADVVGFSRLAGADEDRTLSRLRGCAAI
jgi:class 3 adenylate cyclase